MVKYQASGIDGTFAALADPTRRHVLLRLKDEPGISVSELARPFSLKLPGMMKHLDVLSDAGLITRTKAGRTVSVNLSVGPMQEAVEWLKRFRSPELEMLLQRLRKRQLSRSLDRSSNEWD